LENKLHGAFEAWLDGSISSAKVVISEHLLNSDSKQDIDDSEGVADIELDKSIIEYENQNSTNG